MAPEARRLRAAAAALTLLSGGLMMFAGYVGESESWTTAGIITIPGGIVILGARTLAGRAERVDGRPAGHSLNRVAVMPVVLLAGGVMVFAGYAAAAWTWAVALPLAMLGGIVIGAAFVLNRRST